MAADVADVTPPATLPNNGGEEDPSSVAEGGKVQKVDKKRAGDQSSIASIKSRRPNVGRPCKEKGDEKLTIYKSLAANMAAYVEEQKLVRQQSSVKSYFEMCQVMGDQAGMHKANIAMEKLMQDS